MYPNEDLIKLPGAPRKVFTGKRKASAYRYRINYINPRLVVDQAISGPEGEHCLKAMQSEIDSHKAKNTWTLVQKPKDGKLIDGMWVMKRKSDPNGNVKHKARFVAKGYTQTHMV